MRAAGVVGVGVREGVECCDPFTVVVVVGVLDLVESVVVVGDEETETETAAAARDSASSSSRKRRSRGRV